MALEDKQRSWLNAALKGKGRIKSAGIKKQFENYKRRREKVEVVFKDLPASHSNYLVIQAALAAADKDAKGGEFKAAYKSLDTVKALAKATDAGTSGRILDGEVRQNAELIEKLVSSQVEDVDRLFALFDTTLRRFTALVSCDSKATLGAAIEHRKTIVAVEPDLRASVDAAGIEFSAVSGRMNDRKIAGLISAIEEEFDRLTKSGHDAITQQYNGRVAAAKTRLENAGGKYNSTSQGGKAYRALQVDSEKLLLARKSLDTFKQGEQAQDSKTQGAQSGLKEKDVFQMLDDLIREDARLEVARQQYLAEVERDRAALAMTGTGALQLTPEPPEFDADDFLEGITLNPDGKLKPEERAQAAQEAGQKISDILGDPETPQSVLLDLMSKDQNAIASDLFKKLYPGTDWNDASEKQQDLIIEMSKEMFDKVNSDAPNKVAADASSLTLGGVKYDKVKVLKSGGLGTATLFVDPVSGKKMVMKTPLAGNAEAYDDLLKEMKTMNRVQEGAATGPNASPAPELFGAARGEDGSMHCLMEFVDGGDMDEVGKTINAAANAGFLPAAARTAMQADMVGKAAKALAELQRQGLLHHDIKELNVMMTKEGDVRIIDYGESTFVKDDGKTKDDNTGNATPGYLGGDAFGDGATVQADNFSLGSMLLSMAGGTKVDKWNRKEPEGGALGRLVAALHADPDQRVSLEGLAQSAFMTAAETDFGPEAMDELRGAATDFAQDTKGLKTDKSYEELEAELGHLPVFRALVKPDKSVGLDDAQGIMTNLTNAMDDIYRALQTNPKKLTQEELDQIPEDKRAEAIEERELDWLTKNRDKLTELVKAKAFIQSQVIDAMLDKAVRDAETAYDTALNDDTKTLSVTAQGQTKTMTLKDAVGVHDDLLSHLETRRKAVIEWLESADDAPDVIEAQLAEKNAELVQIDAEAKTLHAQIQETAGPEAKLKFSKARLDEATVPFGPSEARRTQEEIEDDALKTLEAWVKNMDVNAELEELAKTAAE